MRRVEGEGGQHGARTIDEQAHRVALSELLERCVGSGYREEWHEPGCLDGDTERLTTRRENAEPRTATQEGIGEIACRVEEMLAVVEHEQRRPIAQRVDERLDERAARRLADGERRGDVLGEESRIGEGRQLDPGDRIEAGSYAAGPRRGRGASYRCRRRR